MPTSSRRATIKKKKGKGCPTARWGDRAKPPARTRGRGLKTMAIAIYGDGSTKIVRKNADLVGAVKVVRI